MRTCKDCYHQKACQAMLEAQGYSVSESYIGDATRCDTFKDKSLVIDLPCNVGNKIYQFDTAGNIYESVIKNIIFDTTSIAFDMRAIEKQVFLTREAAEQTLKERNINEN